MKLSRIPYLLVLIITVATAALIYFCPDDYIGIDKSTNMSVSGCFASIDANQENSEGCLNIHISAAARVIGNLAPALLLILTTFYFSFSEIERKILTIPISRLLVRLKQLLRNFLISTRFKTERSIREYFINISNLLVV